MRCPAIAIIKTSVASLRSTRGVAAVELALLAPILLLFLVAVIDFGLWIREQMLLTSAARAGVQFVLQDPVSNAGNTAAQILRIQQAAGNASGLDVNAITVTPRQFCECPGASGTEIGCTADCSGGAQRLKYFEVTVTESNFKTLFPYPLIPDPISLSGQSTVRLD